MSRSIIVYFILWVCFRNCIVLLSIFSVWYDVL